jgi:hypothetical protein
MRFLGQMGVKMQSEGGLLVGSKRAILDVMGNPSALWNFPNQASAGWTDSSVNREQDRSYGIPINIKSPHPQD